MNPINKQPVDFEIYFNNWNRTDYSRCNPCHVGVNDAGSFQCEDCLAIFDGARRQIKKTLVDLKGEFWEMEYKKLIRVRNLIRRGRFDKLNETDIYYSDDKGNIVNKRMFYELSDCAINKTNKK